MSARPYAVEDILPAHQLHLLAGASGSGKTSLLFQLMRDWLDGKDWWGHPTHPGTLEYVACDRPADEYEEKFERMGIKPFPVTSLISNPTFSPEYVSSRVGRDLWLSKIWEPNKPDLLVIDPIGLFLPSDMRDYHKAATGCVELGRFAHKHKCTILGLHHATKLREQTRFSRHQDRINGSGALQGFSGTHLFLTDRFEIENDPGYYLLTINPHNAPPESHKMIRNDQGRFAPYTEVEEVTKDMRVLQRLTPEHPIPYTDLKDLIIDTIDCSPRTAERTIKRLHEGGLLRRTADGQYAKPKCN